MSDAQAIREERDGEPELDELGSRFDDDWWDEAFNTLYEPAMRVCSVFGC